MNDCKTILFVSSRSDISGGENYLLSVMRYLDRCRFKPLVILPGGGKFHHALTQLSVASEIIEVDYNGILQQRPWYKLLEGTDRRVNRIVEIIRANNVRLVHTNSNKILDGAFAARLACVPHLYLAHIEYQPNMPIFERVPLRPATFAELMDELSDRIVAVSEGVAQALCPPLDRQRVRVIHNGLEIERLDKAATAQVRHLRKEIGADDGALLVTAVGRIHPDKGFDNLLTAASQVIFQQSVDAHFLIVGAEDDRTYALRLRKLAQELGIESRLHFLGFRDDVPAILLQSDVFVLSSQREGHPFVLLEAMASGCATVATRCNGVADTVTDGITALLVNIGDSVGLANAIGRLAQDENFRTEMGRAGCAHVRSCFTARSCVESLMAVYDEILDSPRRATNPIGLDLFLRTVHEIGALGLRVEELERRMRQVEHLTHWVRQSPIYRSARKVNRWIRGAGEEGQ